MEKNSQESQGFYKLSWLAALRQCEQVIDREN